MKFSRVMRRRCFVGAALLSGSLLVLCGVWQGWTYAAMLVVVALATVTVLGKFAVFLSLASGRVLWGFELPQYSPYLLGALVFYLDALTAVLMTTNFELMCRLPIIGAKIADSRARGAAFLAVRPWFRRMAFLGIVGFVFFPITGTGAILATMIGTAMGMQTARLLMAIFLGGALGGFGFALGADLLGDEALRWAHHPSFRYAGWMLCAAMAVWAAWAAWQEILSRRSAAHSDELPLSNQEKVPTGSPESQPRPKQP